MSGRNASDDHGRERGFISLNDFNQLVFQKTTDTERVARLDELRRIKAMVVERCEVVSSMTVADMSPEKRKQCEELIGPHNLEAISLAKDRQAVLWADDVLVGFIAGVELRVTNVWTQLALRCFVNEGTVTLAVFNVATAKLAAWNCVSIISNPEAIVAAGLAADWDMNKWPLPQCMSLIAKSALSSGDKVQIVIEFLRLLRRSPCGDLRQTPIVQATLDALSDAKAVRWILQRLDEIFPLDFASVLMLRPEFLYWLRLR